MCVSSLTCSLCPCTALVQTHCEPGWWLDTPALLGSIHALHHHTNLCVGGEQVCTHSMQCVKARLCYLPDSNVESCVGCLHIQYTPSV